MGLCFLPADSNFESRKAGETRLLFPASRLSLSPGRQYLPHVSLMGSSLFYHESCVSYSSWLALSSLLVPVELLLRTGRLPGIPALTRASLCRVGGTSFIVLSFGFQSQVLATHQSSICPPAPQINSTAFCLSSAFSLRRIKRCLKKKAHKSGFLRCPPTFKKEVILPWSFLVF